MADHAHKAKVALDNKDYPTAIAHLTSALKTAQSPNWLIQRSTAYQRNNQHELALADADNAVLAARSRGKRELIATAHYRRAVALHGLGRYGDARLCLVWCKKFNEKEKGLTMWMAMVKRDYDAAGGDEAECNQTTVKEVPDEVLEAVKEEKIEEVKPPVKEDKGKGKAVMSAAPVPAPAASAQTQTPKEKVRQEWYQSPNTVTVEIFAKGVPKEKTEVKIEEGSLEISFPIVSSDSIYDFTASPLFSRIDTLKSSFRITPHKIEIILHKSLPGLKWSSLEGKEAIPSSNPDPSSEPPKIPASILKDEKPPAYPTSSVKGPKNWDAVGDDQDEEATEPDDFFKKLYQDADPNAKRAMMKSYQESGGTALSMDWSDVSSKTFKVDPPEGMEAHKW